MASSDITPATSCAVIAATHFDVGNKTKYPFDGMTDDEINGIPHEEFVDKLFAYYDAQGSMLTCEQMDEIEQRWEAERRARRCALITLTKPFSWLTEQVHKDRDFALAIADVLHNTRGNQFYSCLNKLLEAASSRAELALCAREDMQELIAEVKAEQEETA